MRLRGYIEVSERTHSESTRLKALLRVREDVAVRAMDPARLRGVYKECMKNHAATLGTYASDGCCEYIPEVDDRRGALPTQLLCGACGCHRNFHRRETSATPRPIGVGVSGGHGHSHTWAPPELMDDVDGPDHRCRNSAGRRRQRTKFSPEQKARMAGFAERIGWKIPRSAGGDDPDDEVVRFCREIGVTRQVFKVWMHNHKSSCAQLVVASSTSDTAAAAEALVVVGLSGAAGDEVAAACAGVDDPVRVQ